MKKISHLLGAIFLLGWGLGGFLEWALMKKVHASAPTEVTITDPWGSPTSGYKAVLKNVQVGGLDCAILISGQERSTQLWCSK